MSKFKVGDKVVRTHASNKDLCVTKGTIYIVHEVDMHSLYMRNDEDELVNFPFQEYFELAVSYLNEQKLRKVLKL